LLPPRHRVARPARPSREARLRDLLAAVRRISCVRAALLVGAFAAVAVLAGPAASGRQKPYVLTAVADIGTVYWRYDFVHYRTPRWSLGIRIFYTATTEV